jgi:hypothetical protein
MSIIQYSPWQDAAQVGKGIGDALGAILFKVPQLRAEEARENRRLAIMEKQADYQGELSQARSEKLGMELQLLPALRDAQIEAMRNRDEVSRLRLDLDNTKAESLERYRQGRLEQGAETHDLKVKDLEQRGLYQEHRMGLGDKMLAERERANKANEGFRRENMITSRHTANIGAANAAMMGMDVGQLPELAPVTKAPTSSAPQVQQAPPQGLAEKLRGLFQRRQEAPAPKPELPTAQERFMEQEFLPPQDFGPARPGRTDEFLPPQDFGPAKGERGGNFLPPQDFGPAKSGEPRKGAMYAEPPNDTHRIKIQNEATGELFWTDEVGATRHVGRGFRRVN